MPGSRRLRGIAERLGARSPDELAGQLATLVNGAFVSLPLLSAQESVPLLRAAAHALVTAAGTSSDQRTAPST